MERDIWNSMEHGQAPLFALDIYIYSLSWYRLGLDRNIRSIPFTLFVTVTVKNISLVLNHSPYYNLVLLEPVLLSTYFNANY